MKILALIFIALVFPASSLAATHLDISADVAWVIEKSDGSGIQGEIVQNHIEVHGTSDSITGTVGAINYTGGNFTVTDNRATAIMTFDSVTSTYMFVDGGPNGNEFTGPTGLGGYAPTVDYAQNLNASPSVRVMAWVLNGSISITTDPSPVPVPTPEPTPAPLPEPTYAIIPNPEVTPIVTVGVEPIPVVAIKKTTIKRLSKKQYIYLWGLSFTRCPARVE
jgi:hypothetical protein